MFGSPKGSPKFNLGDHLLGLGTQAKMPGSPKGSLKFSLEHSLVALTINLEVYQSYTFLWYVFNAGNCALRNSWPGEQEHFIQKTVTKSKLSLRLTRFKINQQNP